MQLSSLFVHRPALVILLVTLVLVTLGLLPTSALGARRAKRRPGPTAGDVLQQRTERPARVEPRGDTDAGDDAGDDAGSNEAATSDESAAASSSPSRKPGGGPRVRASSELSAYTDSDSVHVLSPTVAGSVSDAVAGWSVGGSYLVDAVSAASVDIISTASSHWQERRHVGSASADFKAAGAQVALASGFSSEPDYLSLGGGGVVSFELADKNFMPFLGGSYGHDLVGRTGDPRSFWQTMDKVSLKTGATFVVNRSTIAAISFDGIFERGYMAKPYRYLPVVAPGTSSSVPAGATIGLVKSLNEYSVAENVPRERDRFAVAGRLAHRFDGSTFRGDQRFYRDTWGLLASTTDLHHYVDLGTRMVVWPHLRGHMQRGVSFWRRVVEQIPDPSGGPAGLPTFRAGDRELGPLYTLTAGLGMKMRVNSDPRAPWTLTFQIDGIYTRYLDAVYISLRRALFSALTFEAAF